MHQRKTAQETLTNAETYSFAHTEITHIKTQKSETIHVNKIPVRGENPILNIMK